MIKLKGYNVKEEIYAGQDSIVYRGERCTDALPSPGTDALPPPSTDALPPPGTDALPSPGTDAQSVIIKILNQEYPSDLLLSYFRREYEIARRVSGEGNLQVYDLVRHNNTLAIVMEDIHGVPLSYVIRSTSLSLSEKLSIAVKSAHSLSLIHKKQIIHKNICPSTIFLNRETGRLVITDFGVAAELKREMSNQMHNGFLEGTPDYMSPEQTGRINRPVDRRSDLYSLGVTLYELFTGKLPFVGKDESEIIYNHIARMPEPPHLIDKEIPETLSGIVMKLLAKDAEDRYQMASGLKRDLELCLESLLANGDIVPFEIGRFDLSDQLVISNKLYGRQDELEKLSMLFNDVADGASSIVLIEGLPGIGKTTLAQEFGKFVSLRKGFFIAGKYNAQEQNLPLRGFQEALHGLTHWLLSLPENQLEIWRQRILEKIPNNAGVLTDLLPEMVKIIGEQPPVVDLNPMEAHNRLLIVISKFIALFATADSPLVIFLDDLQWCDRTSMEILKRMAGSKYYPFILFVLAYRPNEMNPEDYFMVALEEIKSNSYVAQTITLQPLEITVIDEMLADTFRRLPDEDTLTLANLMYRKTGGNPFFVKHLLESLFALGCFILAPDQTKWIWELSRISEVDISDNVIDLLSQRLDELPSSVYEPLKIASCVGFQFDLEQISLLCDQSVIDIGNAFWPAVENEIIYPLDQNYMLIRTGEADSFLSNVNIRFAFQHNRIQQLIYSRIPEQERQSIHLKIGWKYTHDLDQLEESDVLFNVVNHINKGKTLITDPADRKVLRDLNLKAGERAMKSTAFSLASDYFQIADSLLPRDEREADLHAWFSMSYRLGEALFLSGNLHKSEEICNKIQALPVEALDRAKIHNLRARVFEFQGRIPDAIEAIREGLFVLDIVLPQEDDEIGRRIGESIMRLMKTRGSGEIETLADLPIMENPRTVQAMELLFNVIPPALQFRPSLYVLAALMMFELTLDYGVTAYSCKSLIDVGITQSPTLNDYAMGYHLGKTAFRLLERLNAEWMKSAVYFGFTFSSYRNAHFQEAIASFDKSISTGMETGDIQHTAYARAHKIHLYMQIGLNLSECEAETQRTINFLNEVNAGMPLFLAKIIQYMISKYRSEKEIDDDDTLYATIERTHNVAFLWRFCQYNTVYFYIHCQWKQAEKWSQLTDQFAFASQSDFPVPEHSMFKALIIMRLWDEYSDDAKKEKQIILSKIIEELNESARLCPSNFAHKAHFLEAELAILNKAPQEEILEHYRQALASLEEDDFVHMKALICESMAAYWDTERNTVITKAYISEACFFYKKWGALRKVRLMEEKHPRLRTHFSEYSVSSQISQNLSNDAIDMTSILKAMQLLSSEIRIEKLLRSLMSLILENAGARQGALLLVNRDDKDLYIEAQKKSFESDIEIMQNLPYRNNPDLCPDIIQYVARSLENVVLANAWKESDFSNNPHIKSRQIKSVLSLPVLYRNRLIGVIYLEHDLAENVFTEQQIQTLKILSSQASISIENALLYETLEKKVEERTAQLNLANEKLRQLSLQDPLTSLHNRRYISEFVSERCENFIVRKVQVLENCENMNISINRKVMGVFMIDLDHFKTVNDTYGHQAGDTVLVNISRILAKQIRADDYIVRWGGEEFLIILNKTNPEYLDVLARKILKAVSKTPLRINDETTLYKTCSVGYCTLPLHAKTPNLLNLEQIINISDYAMYLAKENGRNRAARISMNQSAVPSRECIEYLQKLSKSDAVREEFIEVSFVDNTDTVL